MVSSERWVGGSPPPHPAYPAPLYTLTWNPRLRGTGQTQQTWSPLRHLRVGQVCGEDVHELRGRLSRDTPAPTPGGIRTKAWWGAMWRAWRAALVEGQLGSLAGTQLWGRHGWVCYITICKKREERKGVSVSDARRTSWHLLPRKPTASQCL